MLQAPSSFTEESSWRSGPLLRSIGLVFKASRIQELGKQLEAAAESARAQLVSKLPNTDETGGRKAGSRQGLPGLQDLKGQWNGTFQAYGGGGGAANVDFNMKGQDWIWGEYFLDKVTFCVCL